MAEQDIFDVFLEERAMKKSGAELLPTFENGFITMREKTLLDTFDQQVQKGVQQLFSKLTLNEETKEDLRITGKVVEGVAKGLFAGGVVNPLALIVDENSKFMQDARQAVEFNPEFGFADMGYEASKFFGSFLGLGKLMAVGKVGRQLSKLGTFGKEAARSVVSDFTAFEGSDENLIDGIMALGVDPNDYPLVEALVTDPDDSDLEGRLKNVLANLPLEALVPTVAVLVKAYKNRASPEIISQAQDNLKKKSNELLDKFSVGAAMNPEGDLAKSIIKEADVNTSVSKLAPDKGEVINLKPKVDRLNFYSKAEEVTNQLKQNKGTGQQYRQQLLKAGVKPDEIEWLGLDDVLNKGKITKQELQDQINANRIELDEVELIDNKKFYGQIREQMNESENLKKRFLGGEKENYTVNNKGTAVFTFVDPETKYIITGNNDQGYEIFRSEADMKDEKNYLQRNFGRGRQSIGSFDEAVIQAEQIMVEEGLIDPPKQTTRFGEYTEPGGDNYREFLIKYDDPKVQFDESHFDEENVIAHFRTKDRTTSDGKKVFYIEEIQSDWGQQFRTQKGFLEFGVSGIEGMKDMPKILNEFTISRPSKMGGPIKDNNYYDWFKSTQIEDSVGDLNTTSLRGLYRNFLIDTGIKNKNGQVATFEEKLKVLKDQGIDVRQGPPKAPFITDTDKWTQLTLKRILSKAVDEGYDFVSLTPGKAQMDRWNDEGVAKFYDEIVPKNAEKIVKKLDKNAVQKDKSVYIYKTKGYEKRFTIELTPQLKEKVKKGMAMFSATPLVVGQENE